MKKYIIEHLFHEAITILNSILDPDWKFPGFETIVIPVERKQLDDFILQFRKAGIK